MRDVWCGMRVVANAANLFEVEECRAWRKKYNKKTHHKKQEEEWKQPFALSVLRTSILNRNNVLYSRLSTQSTQTALGRALQSTQCALTYTYIHLRLRRFFRFFSSIVFSYTPTFASIRDSFAFYFKLSLLRRHLYYGDGKYRYRYWYTGIFWVKNRYFL